MAGEPGYPPLKFNAYQPALGTLTPFLPIVPTITLEYFTTLSSRASLPPISPRFNRMISPPPRPISDLGNIPEHIDRSWHLIDFVFRFGVKVAFNFVPGI